MVVVVITPIMFSSYRDPRLMETLSDYREAIKLLISTLHTNDDIEQAILRVIQDLDKPLSPIGSVSKDLWYVMTKRDPSFMSKYKEAVLSTTIDDVVSMARKYVLGKESVDVVFTNSGNIELLNQEGFIIDDLTL